MIKIGLRFVDLSNDHLQYRRADRRGRRHPALPTICPAWPKTGQVDAAGLRDLLQRLDALNLELAGMELRRARIAGVLRGDPEGARRDRRPLRDDPRPGRRGRPRW